MLFESDASELATQTSARKRRTDSNHLLWLAAGVILTSGLLLAGALAFLHVQALQSGERLGTSFAQVIEEQTDRTLQTVDQRLQLATLALTELQSRGALNPESAHAVLQSQIKDYPYIHALWVLDAQGRIQYDSDIGTLGLDLSDRAYFRAFKDQARTGFYTGVPLRSRTTGTWIINAVRPWPGPGNNQFNGIIVASLELSYFDGLWRGLDLGPGAAIALLGRDGTLILRSPLDPELLGKKYLDNPLFTKLLPTASSGSFTATSPIDGVERLLAYRSLSAMPDLVIVVGRDKTGVLAAWRHFAAVSIVVWVLASVAIFLLSLLLHRSGRSRVRAEEGQARIFERITDAFVALDRKGRCTYANHHAAEMLGVALSSMLGHSVWHVLSGEAQPRMRAACEKAMIDQLPVQVEEFSPRLGLWLDCRVFPSPQGLTVYFQDVSIRKRADDALRASEIRYRQLFEGNPQPMWVVSVQGLRFLAVNEACIASYGYTREEFLNMTLRDIRPQEDVASLLAHLEVPYVGLNRHGQWRHRRKDGSLMLVEIHSHSIDFDGHAAQLVLATDITERQAAQDALRLSDLALKAVSQGVIITGRDRLITSVNDAFLHATGYRREEIVGRNCRFLQGAQTDAQTILAIRAALDSEIEYSGEILNYRKDGFEFWSELTIAPVRDEQGQVSHFIGIVRDISERRQTAQTLQQLSRRVLEAQETERRRVARELHDELGQSLTAIKINLQAEAMFGEHPPSEVAAGNIRIVEDAIQQVRRLALALRPSVLDDLGLIPALRWMTEQGAQRFGLALTFNPDMDDVRFSPDLETACFRIAQEAITNIARYAKARCVTLRLVHDDAVLEMTIEDDGVGFDVDDMRQRAISGTSMGVLGMQERAMLVGGTLDIQSAPGKGCTIRLRCPWKLAQEVE